MAVIRRHGHAVLVTARSDNAKTGDVPTVWVGASLEHSRASCHGCPMLHSTTCYAQFGQVSIGLRSIERSKKRTGMRQYKARVAIDAALNQRRKVKPRMLRVSAIGDAARASVAQLDDAMTYARKRGLAIVGYTHFWGSLEGAWLKGQLMASCNSLDELREAESRGWRATLVVPTGTTGTMRREDGSILAVECPAIAAARRGSHYTCNDCASNKRGALCDASRPGPHVYFADHGPQRRRLKVL